MLLASLIQLIYLILTRIRLIDALGDVQIYSMAITQQDMASVSQLVQDSIFLGTIRLRYACLYAHWPILH